MSEKDLYFSTKRKVLLEGKTFGELFVTEYIGSNKKNWMAMYRCTCSCGNTCIVSHGHLQSGHTKTCGNPLHIKKIHGKSDSKLYDVWIAIKDRCLNPRNPQYHNYGGRGITISEDFVNNFLAFEQELGLPPDGLDSYTVDRINVNLGYQKGNLRWATYATQARNRRKPQTNKSGVTGVCRIKNHNKEYWLAYIHLDGKRKSQYFSISKFGDSVAYEMACKSRDEMLNQARLDGFDFSDNHGK